MKSPLKKIIFLLCAAAVYIIYTAFTFITPAPPKNAVELGNLLFNDRLLSLDHTISCASCHKSDYAFADTTAQSFGIHRTLSRRNTPSITYMNGHNVFFWDGRANSLEQQASGPITNHDEMGLSMQQLVQRLNTNKFYYASFLKIFGRKPDSALIVKALALFEKSLAAYDSPYDHYLKGDNTALSASAKRGLDIFFKRNSCGNATCHSGNDFSSDSLVNIGVYSDADRGLFDLTKRDADIGKFKTPTLRNLMVTAPYMHDGSQKTLKAVVEFYRNMKNFPENGNTSSEVKHQRNIPLTDADVDDLVAFLESLTDARYQKHQ